MAQITEYYTMDKLLSAISPSIANVIWLCLVGLSIKTKTDYELDSIFWKFIKYYNTQKRNNHQKMFILDMNRTKRAAHKADLITIELRTVKMTEIVFKSCCLG